MRRGHHRGYEDDSIRVGDGCCEAVALWIKVSEPHVTIRRDSKAARSIASAYLNLVEYAVQDEHYDDNAVRNFQGLVGC